MFFRRTFKLLAGFVQFTGKAFAILLGLVAGLGERFDFTLGRFQFRCEFAAQFRGVLFLAGKRFHLAAARCEFRAQSRAFCFGLFAFNGKRLDPAFRVLKIFGGGRARFACLFEGIRQFGGPLGFPCELFTQVRGLGLGLLPFVRSGFDLFFRCGKLAIQRLDRFPRLVEILGQNRRSGFLFRNLGRELLIMEVSAVAFFLQGFDFSLRLLDLGREALDFLLKRYPLLRERHQLVVDF